MNFPLILGGLAAVYFLTKKKESPKASSKLPADKGYIVIIPGKQYSIENEEASQIYAYELAKAQSQLSTFEILQKFVQLNETQYKELAFHPNYYAWLYRVYRAVLKGLVEKKKISQKDADAILLESLASLKDAGLETAGLPVTVEGDFEA